VGLATIYRQFPTKEALYEAVVHARLRALAGWGVDVKAGPDDLRDDMVGAIETLLRRAQSAGAVRDDVGMPEVLAPLGAACLAAERGRWDEETRDRALAVMFDGFRRPRS